MKRKDKRAALLAVLSVPRTTAEVAARLKITTDAAGQLCRTYVRSGELTLLQPLPNEHKPGRPSNVYALRAAIEATESKPAPAEPIHILRVGVVEKKTGLLRRTLQRLVAAGEFPAPVRLSPRCYGWRASDIEAWLTNRPAK